VRYEFIGTSSPSADHWSNQTAWKDEEAPGSSNGSKIQLDASSTDDLGTAQQPFLAGDVIGASSGVSFPSLSVLGFLHAHEIEHLSGLTLGGRSSLVMARDIVDVQRITVLAGPSTLNVSYDLVNVQQLAVTTVSTATIGHDLSHVGTVSLSFGGQLEVGHHIGATAVGFGAAGGTLILDRPEHGQLTNTVSFGQGGEKIELGKLAFDKADFIPAVPGSQSGRIQLTEHGRPVYELTSVTFANGTTPVLSVGRDQATGYHFVAH